MERARGFEGEELCARRSFKEAGASRLSTGRIGASKARRVSKRDAGEWKVLRARQKLKRP
ncbi:MAG: hypothetical protein ACTTH5_07530 [Wolinella sp.]